MVTSSSDVGSPKDSLRGGVRLPIKSDLKSKPSDSETFWLRVTKVEKHEKCLNCGKRTWKNKELQVCAECYKHCDYVKCVHCKGEFPFHRYCSKARKLYHKIVCMRCAFNIATYNEEPRLCRYCNTWAAWRNSGECDRCNALFAVYGEPVSCEICENKAAFNRGEASRAKVGGLWLCFLCTYQHKKNNYYSKKRMQTYATHNGQNYDDRNDIEKLKRANYDYKREIESKDDLLRSAIEQLSQLREKYDTLAGKYKEATGEHP